MIRILGFVMFIMFFGACKLDKYHNSPIPANENSKVDEFSSCEILDKLHHGIKDYGLIKYNSDTAFNFHLKCKSEIPLIIYKAETGCACTTAETKTPSVTKFNDSAEIKIRYNTKIKGAFSQEILVFNNSATNPIILTIQGTVN